jgi:hypothetical protein
MDDNDVCGSLMRRLRTRATLREKQSGDSAKKDRSRETDRKDTTKSSCGKAWAAARCVAEFKQSLTRACEQRVVVRSWRMKSERQPLRTMYLLKGSTDGTSAYALTVS